MKIVILLAFCSPLFAADLFEAGKGGYMTYRIPGMVTLGDGTILAYAEARKDGTGDWADIDILLRRSVDNAKTWSDPMVIADAGTLTTNNVVAIPGKNKSEVHLVYCVNYAKAFYRHSKDSGKTFSEPLEITKTFEDFRKDYNWNVIATGPGHGIRLSNGRLLIPVWISTGGKAHRPSLVSTIYSDDSGGTWKRGEIVPGNLVNPSETLAVQLKDGRVMLNIRSESESLRRAVVYSKDGAGGWTQPQFQEELKEPVCMASLIRYPKAKQPLVFVNPDNIDEGSKKNKGRNSTRKNLTLQVSGDDGKTWGRKHVIDPEISAYSDMAVTKDGRILVLYEKGGIDNNMFFTQSLRLAELSPDVLEARN